MIRYPYPGDAFTDRGRGAASAPSSSDASTAFVVGRSTAAGMLRVATSIIQVSSARSTVASSRTTRTSRGVESTITHSPGRTAVTVPNGPSGRWASDRRVGADPNVCRPVESRLTRR